MSRAVIGDYFSEASQRGLLALTERERGGWGGVPVFCVREKGTTAEREEQGERRRGSENRKRETEEA